VSQSMCAHARAPAAWFLPVLSALTKAARVPAREIVSPCSLENYGIQQTSFTLRALSEVGNFSQEVWPLLCIRLFLLFCVRLPTQELLSISALLLFAIGCLPSSPSADRLVSLFIPHVCMHSFPPMFSPRLTGQRPVKTMPNISKWLWYSIALSPAIL
jgi:hypothetical protein